eukprot:scaffold39002_cov150-Skeletonema_dohrnii-CCMP3373.AAC.6
MNDENTKSKCEMDADDTCNRDIHITERCRADLPPLPVDEYNRSWLQQLITHHSASLPSLVFCSSLLCINQVDVYLFFGRDLEVGCDVAADGVQRRASVEV